MSSWVPLTDPECWLRTLQGEDLQGCNFWKLIGGAERGKDAQGNIKILLDADFTSDLAHFLCNIVGAQLNIGAAQYTYEDMPPVSQNKNKIRISLRISQVASMLSDLRGSKFRSFFGLKSRDMTSL